MVHNRVRSDEVPPWLVQKGRDTPRLVSEEPGQRKIDDSPGLRKTVANFFQQLQRHRVQRIDFAEGGVSVGTGRTKLRPLPGALLDRGPIGRHLAQTATGD